jgi:hypothetical protein
MPTYNDYPIEECLDAAIDLIDKGATVHQKWTCGHCGSRQTMEQADTFFRSGICEACKKTTIITKCNYLVHFVSKGKTK